MARISRSTQLSNVVTRQDLYDLLAKSRLADIGATDCSFAFSELGIVSYATDPPPGMAQGSLWYDLRLNVLRIFDAAASYALAMGPDIFDAVGRAAEPMAPYHAITITTAGSLPWVSYVDTALHGYDNAFRCVGVTVASAASGSPVPFTFFGFAKIICDLSNKKGMVSNSRYRRGWFGETSDDGYTAWVDSAFAFEQSVSGAPKWAYIAGPSRP